MPYFYSAKERGFFDAKISPDAVSVTDNDYQRLIDGQKNGCEITPDNNGNPTLKLEEKYSLNQIKKNLKLETDRQAENHRLNYLTGGVGQSLTYQEKVSQAAAYSKAFSAFKVNPKTKAEPNADEYLLLQASLGIDGDTLLEVAETVTYAYAIWQQKGAAIENIRLKAKADLESAKTAEEAQKIYDAISWPS